MSDSARPGPSLENRLPAEGINSSSEHPLKEFSWLIGASAVTLLLIVLLVGWGARWLAPKLPFSTEVTLAERLPVSAQKPADAARSAALQTLADRVARQMNLPADMPIVVRYEDSKFVNAYATVGGRIHVHSALLGKLRSEDELAALLAHEIAHVKHRHVAANMGRGVTLALVLSLVSADAGAAAAQGVLNQTTSLVLLGYSREQEQQADNEAVRAVVAMYGHAGGVMALFDHLGKEEANESLPPQILSTHPLTSSRLQAVKAQAREAGWPAEGQQKALPPELAVPDPKADAR